MTFGVQCFLVSDALLEEQGLYLLFAFRFETGMNIGAPFKTFQRAGNNLFDKVLALLLVLKGGILDEAFGVSNVHIHLVIFVFFVHHLVHRQFDSEVTVIVQRRLEVLHDTGVFGKIAI